MLDDIIRLRLKEIFSVFPYDTFESYTIKITRDGEYDLAEEVTKSLYEKLSTSLQQRSVGDPVRFVYDSSMPTDLLEFILSRAQLSSCSNIIAGGRYHNARDMMSFPKVNRPALYFDPQTPISHHTLRPPGSLMARIEQQDYLISLPYHIYDPVIDLLREASLDPSVLAIKMTLYRVAEDSSVINALRNAARNGKQVVLFIELQARFDEKTNMYWTEKLSRESNITLIGGVEGVKVHSKICVITRMDGKHKRRIAMIGTGNFNENTAQLYSDHVLFTAHPKITEEADRIFDLLGSGFAEVKFKHLVVSPFHTRKRFVQLIKNEIAHAKKGLDARIVLKLNNLVDEQMIEHLMKAAHAGVRIRLMIRGICSLSIDVEGIEPGMIEGKSMIDRYLEHTRIITFHNGGDPQYFIGSADWMGRNLDNRIEVMTPVYDPLVKNELEHFLEVHWNDTYASFSLAGASFNKPLQTGEPGEVRAQKDLYNWYRQLSNSSGFAGM
jgi:polyphosphate kinase